MGVSSEVGQGNFLAEFPVMSRAAEDIDVAVLSDAINGVQLMSWPGYGRTIQRDVDGKRQRFAR